MSSDCPCRRAAEEVLALNTKKDPKVVKAYIAGYKQGLETGVRLALQNLDDDDTSIDT